MPTRYAAVMIAEYFLDSIHQTHYLISALNALTGGHHEFIPIPSSLETRSADRCRADPDCLWALHLDSSAKRNGAGDRCNPTPGRLRCLHGKDFERLECAGHRRWHRGG